MVFIPFYLDRGTVADRKSLEGRKMVEFQGILLKMTKPWRTSSSTTIVVFSFEYDGGSGLCSKAHFERV